MCISARGIRPLLGEFPDVVFSSFEYNQFRCAEFRNVSRAFDFVCHNIFSGTFFEKAFVISSQIDLTMLE